MFQRFENLLRKHPKFIVQEKVLVGVKKSPIGFYCKIPDIDKDIFISMKSYIYNPASIEKDIFDKCVAEMKDIGILYFKGKDRKEFEGKKPLLLMFDIRDIYKRHRVDTESYYYPIVYFYINQGIEYKQYIKNVIAESKQLSLL